MNNEKILSISNPVLTDFQINDLARPLIGILQKFYEDPKNEHAFQEWLKQQEKHTSK